MSDCSAICLSSMTESDARSSLKETCERASTFFAIASPSESAWPGPIPRTSEFQRNLSLSYIEVGNVLAAPWPLAEALQFFGDSLAIRQRLAKLDPRNAQWQRGSVHDPIIRLARCWSRKETTQKRCNPSATALQSGSAWPRPIPTTPDGSSICLDLTSRSEKYCARKETGKRPCNPSGTAKLSGSAWPSAIPTTPDGRAIWPHHMAGLDTYCLPKGSWRKPSNPSAIASPFASDWPEPIPATRRRQLELSIAYGNVARVQEPKATPPKPWRAIARLVRSTTASQKTDPDNVKWERELAEGPWEPRRGSTESSAIWKKLGAIAKRP